MIITRTPLRISFVGGGSDLPWFFSEEPGACVAATINKYVYVTYSHKYEHEYRAAYSQMETVTDLDTMDHALIRETLKMCSLDYYQMGGREIHSIADIPGGTGLGSSSAFTVGLCRAIYPSLLPSSLIGLAAAIEIDKCGNAVGLQDHYTATYGGIQQYTFEARRASSPVTLACDAHDFASHCLLLDTGIRRAPTADAGSILAKQRQPREDVRELARLAHVFAYELERGDFRRCGSVLEDAWSIKRRFITNDVIDAQYAMALNCGAWGGKLCGAGDGGFLLFMAPYECHADIVRALKLRQVPFQFESTGSRVVFND